MAVSVPPNYYDANDNIGTIRTAQISVPTTPILILPYQVNRTRVTIQNLGPNALYLGTDATLTVTNGYRVTINNVFTIFNSAEIWCVFITAPGSVAIIAEQTT